MYNSCLNTQCFFLCGRKKYYFSHLWDFYFIFFFLDFFFEKKIKTEKEIDGGLKDVIIYCQSWKMTNHFLFRLKTGI